MVAKPLIDTLSALTVEQRFEVLDWLQNNLEGGEVPLAHQRTLDSRLDALEADPNAGSEWPEVEARLRARLNRS